MVQPCKTLKTNNTGKASLAPCLHGNTSRGPRAAPYFEISLFSFRHSLGETPYTFLNAREKCSWLG